MNFGWILDGWMIQQIDFSDFCCQVQEVLEQEGLPVQVLAVGNDSRPKMGEK